MNRTLPTVKLTAAQRRLVEKNQGLVWWVINRHYRGKVQVDTQDLFGYGCIGLSRAAQLWKPGGAKFSTYAPFHIWQAISRNLEPWQRMIHVPQHLRYAVQRGDLSNTHTADADKALKIKLVRPDTGQRHSYDEEFGTWDIIPDRPTHDTPEYRETQDRVRQLLSLLSPREREIVERNFGITGREENLGDIGTTMGVSKERIRQVRNIAIEKLKLHAGVRQTAVKCVK